MNQAERAGRETEFGDERLVSQRARRHGQAGGVPSILARRGLCATRREAFVGRAAHVALAHVGLHLLLVFERLRLGLLGRDPVQGGFLVIRFCARAVQVELDVRELEVGRLAPGRKTGTRAA